MKKELIIIGAGGCAKIILDAVIKQEMFKVKGFCIDTFPIGEKIFDNYSVIDNTQLSTLKKNNKIFFIAAIGDNMSRKLFYETASKKFEPATIIHPSAIIGSRVFIGKGSV